ncbi:MAG: sugar phosphate isomerase/epimerase, partial [Chloroflexi bacterium]|nr:sugar phosphate isomerase/epimerase [Chloroflexota bacterium]
MRFGCCVGTREQIDILARAGYDFCELPTSAVRPFDDDAVALPALRELEQAPLRPESFNVLVPPQLPLAGPKVDHAALRTYLQRAFSRMVRLGAEVVVLGSGGARRIPDGTPRGQGLEQLAASLAVALEEANRAGITLALEHLNRKETNTFNSVAESQQFIEETRFLEEIGFLAHHGMRLLVDLHHIEMEQEPLEHVIDAAPLIAHVHVADGGRRAPGVGGVIGPCGYSGPFSYAPSPSTTGLAG